MILIAGGTGTLGTRVVPLLTERGLPMRVLTRDPARAIRLESPLVEIAMGDVRDPHAVARAMDGVETVIAAVHGFAGRGDENPRTVDGQGNHTLITAARTAGVAHVILVSVHGAAPDHPMELMRMKYRAEQELQASGLAWTIIRPTAYLETWGRLIGAPLLQTGRTRVFGPGANPINFVSANDVARIVAQAVVDPALRNRVVNVAGSENMSLRELAAIFMTVTGTTGRVSAIPLPLMRVMALLLRPLNPTLARQIQAGVVMETTNMAVMAVDPQETSRRFPSLVQTRWADVIRRDYLQSARAERPPRVPTW